MDIHCRPTSLYDANDVRKKNSLSDPILGVYMAFVIDVLHNIAGHGLPQYIIYIYILDFWS